MTTPHRQPPPDPDVLAAGSGETSAVGAHERLERVRRLGRGITAVPDVHPLVVGTLRLVLLRLPPRATPDLASGLPAPDPVPSVDVPGDLRRVRDLLIAEAGHAENATAAIALAQAARQVGDVLEQPDLFEHGHGRAHRSGPGRTGPW